MSKKLTIKSIFDKKISKEHIYNNVLMKIENKKNMKLNSIIKFAAAPACIVAIILCSILALNNTADNLLQTCGSSTHKEGKKFNNSIIINKTIISQTKLDADVKHFKNTEKIDILEDIILPKDLVKYDENAIYVKSEKSNKYDKLYNYEFSYSDNKERDIIIAFSNTNKPLRDYHFEDNGENSFINNIKLKIYQYEESYMTEFIYKGYNFDIETTNITQQELIALLESIIK